MAPVRTDFSRTAGLDNFNLLIFDIKTVELIDRFLMRLPAPVCLVPHNGYKLDYPLFNAELKKCPDS